MSDFKIAKKKEPKRERGKESRNERVALPKKESRHEKHKKSKSLRYDYKSL